MRLQPGYTDVFISPVTGRITLSGLPLLQEDYVWIGDRNNRPIPSPVIIDLKLEVIEINSRLAETKFILQTASEGFYNSQALDQLRNGILRHEQGVVKIATLPEKNIWIGDSNEDPIPYDRIFLQNLPSMLSSDPTLLLGAYNLYMGNPNPLSLGEPIIVKTLNITNMADLQEGWLWIGTNSIDPLNFGSNRPVAKPTIQVPNLPDLGFKKIWRGDITGRPVESGDLTDVEIELAMLQFELAALQLQVSILETTVAGLVVEVSILQGQMIIVFSTLAGIAVSLEALDLRINNTNIRIDNLRINTLPIDGDIDIYGYRIKGMPCDPIYDLEPTTLCFIWHLMHDEVNILWP